MPTAKDEFFEYLAALDCSQLKVYGQPEGTIVFPRVPVMRLEGPLLLCQLLETTLLNACNYASLMATNAARFRIAAGPDKTLLEFGLRRAQGPDGAMSASRYSYLGGFDGTSNVAAAASMGIVPRGTHAHSYVSAHESFADLSTRMLGDVDLVAAALQYRVELGYSSPSDSELAAFVAFAQAFPQRFLALVDTYDTLASGMPNFICVALALTLQCGVAPVGVRLDSGDLAYLSKEARKMLHAADAKYGTQLAACTIVASNSINEAVLHALDDQAHEIDTFGIGTNLVTCQAQPALGMVYKLVEIKGKPRMKISQEISKVTIPAAKEVFRLVGSEHVPLLDLIVRAGESRPAVGKRMLCRHPFDEKKRCFVTPTAVVPLLGLVWLGSAASVSPSDAADASYAASGAEDSTALQEGSHGRAEHLRSPPPSMEATRAYVQAQLALLREDHLRAVNPTPYKVSVTSELYHYIHDLWLSEVPIPELA